MLGPEGAQYGVIFAFQVLPTIIFIAALFAILYYFGIMQLVVRAFAVVMHRVMRASGAESLNVAASIFMGQTEAPLTIRPFLPRMTESELMTVMTAGMAHISGGIMAAYILFGIRAEHLLTAVIMTAPGTLMMAKMFVPETQVPETMGSVKLEIERTDVNVIDAAGRGTGEGLSLALNVGAMLISFLALIALVNAVLGLADLSLEQIFGWVFAPIAWAMGVPWRDAPVIGNLLGTRMALNEFVAYAKLGSHGVDARSEVVHDRDLRALRLRQLQLDRHPDRRHRRAGADAAARSGPARPPRDAGRHPGEFRDRDHCRVPAVARGARREVRGARCDARLDAARCEARAASVQRYATWMRPWRSRHRAADAESPSSSDRAWAISPTG